MNHIHNVVEATSWLSVAGVGAVAALGGVNLSLTALRIKRTKVFIGHASLLGILGVVGGVFAASCAACSTALVSLLGITGGLAIFPFGGLEISILAITILCISLYYLSKSMLEFGLLA